MPQVPLVLWPPPSGPAAAERRSSQQQLTAGPAQAADNGDARVSAGRAGKSGKASAADNKAAKAARAAKARSDAPAEDLGGHSLASPFEPWGAERPVPLPYLGDAPGGPSPGAVATLPGRASGGGAGQSVGGPWMILGLVPLAVLLIARAALAWWRRSERYY